ncbi:hypothetical protein JQU17_08540 [Ponticoccus sp. SC2-23]|uniref:hypothetical protein n=1 Tax=Alexandriicola marinus TaxID=2081710 RepID=UPI000FDB71BA|nr:hypothetical protein [Alexandriicola marinus]MBM1220266.1 hypothetical protein [Ponticoccus sp. SC6-9]MBM1224952.1 hypothetical protein [Ponticoccus sp. SC6-15]MBM1228466.1 hypothetical protein [Ponticoccus sp. SC6-38]MBM1233897.1 hypothetical protein [Ponticoccus sp. SC6-45]MBM1238967.1 hypothetical protein [Ponticoccus sp. SC6-49]MBM1242749.1 hypothetical protein [Ponticoccus sp. SC2-64]MBM1247421.1 hypothetical protein [Ponticoccus sp. SC6-42]MBM1251920.1 hypothetical protein [Pontico
MGVIRLFVVAFVVLTVIYVSISLYSRAVRRDKLEREWDEEIREGDRDAFVKEGLADYDGSLRRRLILAVYIIPVAIVGTIIYLVNY